MAIGRIIRRGVQRAVSALRRRTNRKARKAQTLTPEQGRTKDDFRRKRREYQPKEVDPKRRSPGAEPWRERDPLTAEALRKKPPLRRKPTPAEKGPSSAPKRKAKPEIMGGRHMPDLIPEYLRRRPPVPPGTRKKALDWPWPSTEVKPKRRPAKPQKPTGGIVSTK